MTDFVDVEEVPRVKGEKLEPIVTPFLASVAVQKIWNLVPTHREEIFAIRTRSNVTAHRLFQLVLAKNFALLGNA